jgi:hypothetical protein
MLPDKIGWDPDFFGREFFSADSEHCYYTSIFYVLLVLYVLFRTIILYVKEEDMNQEIVNNL